MSNRLTKFNSLAVSGQACSGKSTICTRLSQTLNWKHINIGAEFKKLTADYGLAIEKFGSLPEERLRGVDKEVKERMLKEPNSVWDGRLACYLSWEIPTCFKVYCVLPMEKRAQRLANREKITFSEAKKVILRRDEEEKNTFNRLYGLTNPYNEKWVTLVLDTSESPDTLVQQVIERLHSL